MYLSNNIITNNMLNNNAKKYLLQRGIEEKIALDLGFFSVSETEGKQLINQSIGGLAITYHDFDLKPIAYRLRPFNANWKISQELADYYMAKNDELPKFLSKPKGQGKDPEEQRINKAYFSPATKWKTVQQKSSIDVIITEGEIKASLACLNDVPTIALPGVNGIYNNIQIGRETIKEFLPELEWECQEEFRETYWQGRNVGLCFDSDINSKWQVQNALIKLANEIKKRGGKPFLILLPTEANGDKNGIDDFIVAHGAAAFKKLIEQFKILQKSQNKLLSWDVDKSSYKLGNLEPIASIKGLMAWSCLKDNLAYREGYGWYEWRGKNWKLITESQVLNSIQSFRYANQWLQISDEICLKELKSGIANHEIEWNPRNILGFENGYLNTDTNELIAHDKSLYLTTILPFGYNLKAQCPQWLKFLSDTFEGDNDKIEYLRAWFKWILFPEKPENYPIEATLWLIGEPQTGKGTTLSVLRSLTGKDNIGGFEPDQMTNPNHLFGLVDKKLALNTDVTGFIGNVGIYNRICSNEPVTVKNLYHNQFETCLNTVSVLAMNKPVGFPSGGSEGLSRRLHVLNFDKKATIKDPDLKQKLATEIEGIFAWCWGLNFPQVKQILNWRVTDAVKEIYQGQITEILFLQEKYPDGKDFIKASDLYSEFAEWAKNNGYKSSNSQNFYLALKKIKGVIKNKMKSGIFYTIPSMEKYADPEFYTTTFKPTDAISNTNERLHGSCNNAGFHAEFGEGFCPDTEGMVQGLHGFSTKVAEGSEKNNSQSEVIEQKPTKPCTIQSQQGLNPAPNINDTQQPCITASQQPIEPKVQNNQDELSKYESFQKVGKLNSCDIREARNRSEKIKNDILASANNEELKLVREDFGYLPQEIEWVWTHLLSKQEKAQIKQMTEQNQTELTLESSNENSPKLDFMDIIRENAEILQYCWGAKYATKKARKQWYTEFLGEDKPFNQYSDEQILKTYNYLQDFKKKK